MQRTLTQVTALFSLLMLGHHSLVLVIFYGLGHTQPFVLGQRADSAGLVSSDISSLLDLDPWTNLVILVTSLTLERSDTLSSP